MSTAAIATSSRSVGGGSKPTRPGDFAAASFTMTGIVNATALVGDAKSSPIVRQKTSANGIFGVSYWF
jgi:hypothetical protein